MNGECIIIRGILSLKLRDEEWKCEVCERERGKHDGIFV